MAGFSGAGIVFVLLVTTTLCCAVSANPVIHHATIVYFDKDNQSIDASITYSLDCYGHRCTTWDCSAPEDREDPAEYTQELLLRNAGICPPSYGCIISEDTQTSRNVGFHIDSCTISGDIQGKKIAMDNYSDTRYGCYLTMFKDGEGSIFSDYCALSVSLPLDLDVPVRTIDASDTMKSANLKTYRNIHVKKGFVDE